ncbi:hypothetical protein CAI16_07000 [Virgibacillus dokdonensis]|uniref:Uncharacterized protein n=1 Tax=Virgibacillus dokdonensis TaxID=302167 RepID=A0A3E0WUW8_9BACI|nr:hypothetical protein CAI16_07000 [Virgibacillus dokdonensis]
MNAFIIYSSFYTKGNENTCYKISSYSVMAILAELIFIYMNPKSFLIWKCFYEMNAQTYTNRLTRKHFAYTITYYK